MHENEISGLIIHIAYQIHTKLGPGLLESVYENVLAYELQKHSLKTVQQPCIPLQYEGMKFDMAFKADLIVENKVLVELKSVKAIEAIHEKQVLTYLRLTGLRLGLLINFNSLLIKDGIHRIVNRL